MPIPEKKSPYLHSPTDQPQWDWWGENPVEIILVIFIVILFFFIHSLPPQGWGIDDVATTEAEANLAAEAVE